MDIKTLLEYATLIVAFGILIIWYFSKLYLSTLISKMKGAEFAEIILNRRDDLRWSSIKVKYQGNPQSARDPMDLLPTFIYPFEATKITWIPFHGFLYEFDPRKMKSFYTVSKLVVKNCSQRLYVLDVKGYEPWICIKNKPTTK